MTCYAKKAVLCYALLSTECAGTCQETEQSIAIYTGTLFCAAPHMKLMSEKIAQRAWKMRINTVIPLPSVLNRWIEMHGS